MVIFLARSIYQALDKLFTYTVSPKDTFYLMLEDTFHNVVQENQGCGDPGEFLREQQKIEPTAWRWVLCLSFLSLKWK